MNSVSIITRTKNRALLLERAIRSVTGQSHQHWELIIVNDGGDPAPVEALVQKANDVAKSKIKVLHHAESLGMEAASNAGLRTASGRYVIIHDDDDAWAPEFLTVMLRELQQQAARLPSIKGIACRATLVMEEIRGQEVIIKKTEKFRPDVQPGLIPLHKIFQENFFAPIQFLYERAVFDKIGMYRDTLPVLGDWEFNVRFMREFDIFYIADELAFYHHRVADRSSIYGNSVIASHDKHLFFNQALKNEWLRDDIKHNRAGMIQRNACASGQEVDLIGLSNKVDLLTRYNLFLKFRDTEKKIRQAFKKKPKGT